MRFEDIIEAKVLGGDNLLPESSGDDDTQFRFSFSILNKHRKIRFLTKSPADAEKWVTVLNAARHLQTSSFCTSAASPEEHDAVLAAMKLLQQRLAVMQQQKDELPGKDLQIKDLSQDASREMEEMLHQLGTQYKDDLILAKDREIEKLRKIIRAKCDRL